MSAQAGTQMTCREMVELVTDYLEGRLSPEAVERFDRHLSSCPGCTLYIEQMRLTLRALGRIPEESISSHAREELLEAFRGWRTGR